MNTRKYLIKNSLVACLVGCCVSLASAGNPPFFTTDAVLNAKGGAINDTERNETSGYLFGGR